MEWYGGKDAFLNAVSHPVSKEVAESYAKRENAIRRKQIEKRSYGINSHEIREIIGEYGFIMKQLTQIQNEKECMLQLAQTFRNERIRSSTDEQFGTGASEFFAQAIEAFYSERK